MAIFDARAVICLLGPTVIPVLQMRGQGGTQKSRVSALTEIKGQVPKYFFWLSVYVI